MAKSGPLSDLRVVSLAVNLPGPLAAALLGVMERARTGAGQHYRVVPTMLRRSLVRAFGMG